jgi:hypothetical protein
LNDSQFDNPACLDNPEQHLLCSGMSRENMITFTRSLCERNLSNGDTVRLLAKPFGVPEENPISYSKATCSITFG